MALLGISKSSPCILEMFFSSFIKSYLPLSDSGTSQKPQRSPQESKLPTRSSFTINYAISTVYLFPVSYFLPSASFNLLVTAIGSF